jgi:hypothetical protein
MKATGKAFRVAVVGLLPRQAQRLRRVAGFDVDLHFLPAGRCPDFPPGCSRVVLMTRFIPHAWHYAAYAHFGRDQVHLCAGGTGQLVKLFRLLNPKPRGWPAPGAGPSVPRVEK